MVRKSSSEGEGGGRRGRPPGGPPGRPSDEWPGDRDEPEDEPSEEPSDEPSAATKDERAEIKLPPSVIGEKFRAALNLAGVKNHVLGVMIGVSKSEVTKILKGERVVDYRTVLRAARFLRRSPEYFLDDSIPVDHVDRYDPDKDHEVLSLVRRVGHDKSMDFILLGLEHGMAGGAKLDTIAAELRRMGEAVERLERRQTHRAAPPAPPQATEERESKEKDDGGEDEDEKGRGGPRKRPRSG